MKKTLLLLAAFVIFGGGAFWLMNENKDDKKTSLLGEDRKFAIEDVSTIHKIFIVDHQNNRTTLVRNGNHWVFNDKYVARANAMENLLKAIQKVEVKYQPSSAGVDHIVRVLSSQGIKVEIYNKQNDLIKSYYMGGAAGDERGTYMIMAGADQPYVSHMSSWAGNILYRYNLKNDDWRDRTIFNTEIDDVKKVAVEYPKQKNKSYEIKEIDGKFSISPFYDITPQLNGTVSQGKFQQYLNGFEKIGAIGFENLYTKRDSLVSTIPFCKISLTKRNDEVTTLEFFPIFPKGGYDEKTKTVIPAVDKVSRYYGLFNDKDLVLLDQQLFKDILWSYESFYK